MTDTAVIFDIIGRDRTSAAIAASSSAFSKFAIGLAAGAAFAGAKFVDMAANFQQGMTRLKTGAGEVDSNMSIVSKGILQLAGEVGESTKDLLSGMYLIESAGFHGANGLNVLKVAAEGAKVGNADMATVADAVTTGLNAYHMSADKAAQVTNALVAAEGQGKTNLEALAGSLSTVAPIASLAGVSLNELLAAMSTMTAQGTDANSAATYLKQTIGQLSNPTAKARAEMKNLGLDATQVSMNLGKNGLAATLLELTNAIQAHMGPAGTVLIQQLEKASGNTTEFQKILANLPPTQQTFIGALATMTGGTKSMQAALELTGANMQVFQHNTDVINEKVRAGGSNIEGWSDVQKNFNQQMAEAKGKLEAVGIEIGTVLMPKVLALITGTMSLVNWFTKHKDTAKALAIGIGILATAFVTFRTVAFAAEIATKTWWTSTKVYAGAAKIATAVQWLWNASILGFPALWVIAAILAIAAAVYVVIKYHKQIGAFFVTVWHGFLNILKDVWGWIKGNWPYLLGALTGPFGLAAAWVYKHWGEVTKFFIQLGKDIAAPFEAAGRWIVNAWGPVSNFFVNLAKVIAAPYLWLWHNVFDPVFQGMAKVVQVFNQIIVSAFNLWVDLMKILLAPVVNWLWHSVLDPAYQGMAKTIQWLWNNILKPIGDFWVQAYKDVASWLTWLWHSVFVPAYNDMGKLVMWLYNNAIKPTGAFIMASIHAVGDTISWLWHNAFVPAVQGIGNLAMWLWHSAITPAFNGIASIGKWLYNNVLHPTFNGIITAMSAVGSAAKSVFNGVKNVISGAFSGLAGIVKGAWNNVVSVINRGIAGANSLINMANKFPGVNFPHIPSIPKLASGGVLTRGGLVTVGERGAETVSLPAGAAVYPHGSAPRGMGAGGRVLLSIGRGGETAIGRLIHELIRIGVIQLSVDGKRVEVTGSR
jgi:TP901 family phage tail tape measure protein